MGKAGGDVSIGTDWIKAGLDITGYSSSLSWPWENILVPAVTLGIAAAAHTCALLGLFSLPSECPYQILYIFLDLVYNPIRNSQQKATCAFILRSPI